MACEDRADRMMIPSGRGFIDRATGEITHEYIEGTPEQLDALVILLAEAGRKIAEHEKTCG